jgi:hypothetical protein
MTTIDITTLEASVEALIQQQVAAYEASLREALGRRLAADGGRSSPRRTRRSEGPKRRQPAGPRRTTAELEALGERLLKAVEATPGETMMTLAQRLGIRAREFQRPVQLLRRTGRIRMVGQRSQARYYPMTPRTAPG